MTALEIRLIGYALVLLALLSSAGYVGYKVTRTHYESILSEDKAAQAQALFEHEKSLNEWKAKYEQQIETASAEHALAQAHNARVVDDLTGQLRELETALSRGGLPPAVAAAAGGPGAPAGAGGDRDLAGAIERFNAAAEGATRACLHDAASLAHVQAVSPAG